MVGNQFGAYNVLFRGPRVFLDAGLHILGVLLNKRSELHIQVGGSLIELFTLPCLRFALGLEAAFLCLFPFTCPVHITVDDPPCICLFLFVDSQLCFLLCFARIADLFQKKLSVDSARDG